VSLYQLVWDEDEHDAPSVMPSLAFEWNTPPAPAAPARPALRAVDGETRASRALSLVRATTARPAARRPRERRAARPSARRGGVHSLLAARPPPA
jgi:hypothetical protein